LWHYTSPHMLTPPRYQSGVDLDNAGDFLKNGASSVGLVAPLFPPDAVAGEKWDVIQANAEKVIGNVKASGMTGA
jgi:2-dehydro-3-deoxyphosphogluconate aldolase / (4S)-4-hydroxy-2-oxoglutarate aldolase